MSDPKTNEQGAMNQNQPNEMQKAKKYENDIHQVHGRPFRAGHRPQR
jgi:hypothetical protein